MRDPFNRFALRYLGAVVCGLALLLLHSTAQSGLPAAFVPQCPSPWELSKLAFWPGLAAWVMTSRLGGARRPLLRDLPAAVLAPLPAAAADTNARQVVLAGGVAANGRLRQLVNDGAQKLGAKIFLPELKYCGDNGAMIAAQGYYEFQDGNVADWSLNGLPTLPIDYR